MEYLLYPLLMILLPFIFLFILFIVCLIISEMNGDFEMNNATNNQSVRVGPGLVTLLTLAFFIAKITGYITWSWWWVFSPIWISAIVVVLIVLAFIIMAVLTG
jgi:hypothetical protein